MKAIFTEKRYDKLLEFLEIKNISKSFFEDKLLLKDKYLISGNYARKIGGFTQEVRHFDNIYVVIMGYFGTDNWWYVFTDNKKIYSLISEIKLELGIDKQ